MTCELAANKTGYIIRGFTGISASQTVTIEAVTENPPYATDYKIQVFSYSTTYNAFIDEAYDYITIQNQCKYFLLLYKLIVNRWYFQVLQISFSQMD